MDDSRFDTLARSLASVATRRRTLAGLLAGAIPASVIREDAAEARKGSGKRQRRGKTDRRRAGQHDHNDAVGSEKKKKKKNKKNKNKKQNPSTQPTTQPPATCSGGKTRCGSSCVDTTSDQANCGGCGKVCPGAGQANADVACQNSVCTFTCRGEAYDVNDSPADGCEQTSSFTSHTKETATFLGSHSCTDTDRGNFTATILSDMQIHDPAISGFDPVVGAAPQWWRVFANDTQFFCFNNVELQVLQTNGTTGCYKVTVTTDKVTRSADIANGAASISLGPSGQYSTNSNVYFSIEKTCAADVHEAATFEVGFNL